MSRKELDIRTRARLMQDGARLPADVLFAVRVAGIEGDDRVFTFASEGALAHFLRFQHPTPFDSALHITTRAGRGESAVELIGRLKDLIDGIPTFH